MARRPSSRIPAPARRYDPENESIFRRVLEQTIEDLSGIVSDLEDEIAAGAGGGGSLPTDFSGLQLWLRADTLALSDGQAVGTWPDESGNGNDATGVNTPTYRANVQNGLPAVECLRASNEHFTVADTAGLKLDQASTVFVVAESDGAQSALLAKWPGGSSAGAYYLELTSGDVPKLDRPFVDGGVAANTFVDVATFFMLSTLVAKKTGTNYYVQHRSQHGTQVGLDPIIAAGTATTHSLVIGGNAGGTSPFINGHLGEIIIYNRALSGAETEAIEKYLTDKWGL